MTKAAGALEPSSATPSEIAVGAAQRCENEEVQYFVAETFNPPPGGTGDLKAHAEGVRAVMKDKAIAAVVEVRAAHANRPAR